MINQKRLPLFLITIIKIGILFILFLPLVMNSQFFFPFIVVKNVLFRLAVEIIVTAYVVLAYYQPEYRPKFNKLAWAVLVFFGVSLIAAVFGIGWSSSFLGNYERMSGIFHHLHLILYFFVLFNTFKSKQDWHTFFSFSVFASMLMCFFAFAQWLQVPFLMRSSGGSRLSGTVGNATFLAAYLLFNLFFILYFRAKEERFNLKLFVQSFIVFDLYLVIGGIFSKFFAEANWGIFNFLKVPILNEAINYPALFYPFLVFQGLIIATWFLKAKRYSVKILLTILFLFEFLIFFNTQTRGAMLGFAASLAFLSFVALFLPVGKRFKTVGIASLLIIIVSPFILVAAKDLPLVKNVPTLNRLASISLTDITSESRLLTWRASWQGWTETTKSFLIGYGPENYYYAFNKYFPAKIYKDDGSQIWFDRAHNIIFDVGVTTGIVGLLVYLSMLTLAGWSLAQVYKKNQSFSSSWLLVGLIVAYFAQNFFVFDTLNTEVLAYLFLAFIVFLNLNLQPETPAETDDLPPSASPNLYYLIAVVVIVLLTGLVINIKTLQANHYIYKALMSTNDAGVALDYFEKAINSAVTGKFEARQQLTNLALSLNRNENISLAQRAEIIDRALTELENSVKAEPLNVRHYIWLASLYNEAVRFDQNRLDKAIEIINQGLLLSPTRPQLYFELGQAYLLKGDEDKGIEYFQKGIDQVPWVMESHLTMISVAIITGREDLVQSELDKISQLGGKLTVGNYRAMINNYLKVKNYPRAVEFQVKVVELEPNNANNYFMLANIYALIGEDQKARQLVEQGLAIKPEARSDATKFLELLDQGKLKGQ